ncbi:MAG TPA: response regulator, partial [Candidatus Latescibacteria bacterium]|nr:response regulator [Candidatus Latescibacterota bacterium]
MARQRKHTVLVVDDESAILESLRAILEDDFEVFSASSGSDALRIVREKVPTLVFLDIRFPEEDGMEILTTIKQL